MPITGLESLRTAVDQTGISQVQGPLLDMVLQVRQSLRTAAVNTNRQVSDYLHDAGARAQSTLYSVQQLLDAASGSLGGVSAPSPPTLTPWPPPSPRWPPASLWHRAFPAIWPIWRRMSAA